MQENDTPPIDSIFDSREWATIALVLVVAAFALLHPKVRPSALRLLRQLLWSRLTFLWIGGLAWLGGGVFLLKSIRMWDWSDLKSTIMWAAYGGIVIVFQGIQDPNPNRGFNDTIKEPLKLMVFVELLNSAYVFSFFTELTLLVVFIFLGGMIAMAENKPETARVGRVLSFVQGVLVFALLAAAVIRFFREPERLLVWSTLYDLALPVFLTLFLVPFGYAVALYAAYETLFLAKLGEHVSMPSRVRNYARLRIFLTCRFNANSVRRAQAFLPSRFRWAPDKATVDAEMFRLRKELAGPEALPQENDA